jgi:hypothetical protein
MPVIPDYEIVLMRSPVSDRDNAAELLACAIQRSFRLWPERSLLTVALSHILARLFRLTGGVGVIAISILASLESASAPTQSEFRGRFNERKMMLHTAWPEPARLSRKGDFIESLRWDTLPR